MNKELLVYDEFSHQFRPLDEDNYNDALVCGSVLLKRESIVEIKRYFYICGYALIEKKTKNLYPIDIQKDKIVIFEGTYNCMPAQLKEALIDYNITNLMGEVWSSFFVRWQFFCDDRVFSEYGPFIKLCHNTLSFQERRDCILSTNNVALYEPVNYRELCEFTRTILEISNIDVNNFDYYTSIKYLIDSLINGYHINFNDSDITMYFYQISKLVDERWGE